MSFWVVSFGGEEWISCFHKEDKQTNKPKICCRDTQLSFFLSFFPAFDRSVATENRHWEKKGREGKGRRKENNNKNFLVLKFDFVNFLVL
jgi:hypothetical protein